MVPCSVTSPSSSSSSSLSLVAAAIIPRHTTFSRFPLRPLNSNASLRLIPHRLRRTLQVQAQAQSQPRTLFPGGFKRPEVKVPTLILQLDPDEVLSGGDAALDMIDKAVSRWVGIVVLASNDASGGRLYEAACVLKSLVRDRAYLLVAERVDIAAAAEASGVLLSDQGLPIVVARNTMLGSKAELVVLPLVGRVVQTIDAAVNASKSEGADFLIYGGGDLDRLTQDVGSVCENVKIPIFVSCPLQGKNMSYDEASCLLTSGASGFVTSLENFGLFDGDFLHKLFDTGYAIDERVPDDNSDNKILNASNGFQTKTEVVAGFVKLEDREKQLIETERLVLSEAIEVIKKAAPLVIF